MAASMPSGIDNEIVSTDVDDSRFEHLSLSSSDDDVSVSEDNNSIFGDPGDETDNVSHAQ